jgi:hypothetical protein
MLRTACSRLCASAATAAAQQAGPCPGLQRSMSIIVNVQHNNVDKAMGILKGRAREAGLQEELAKRDHRITSQEAKFAVKRNTYNASMGQAIRERLKWIIKRRKHR